MIRIMRPSSPMRMKALGSNMAAARVKRRTAPLARRRQPPSPEPAVTRPADRASQSRSSLPTRCRAARTRPARTLPPLLRCRRKRSASHPSRPLETSYFHIAVTFDPEKNAKNIAERGLSFERVAEFDWDAALIAEDIRRDYGETRLRVMPRWPL
jgi:hypothetical protein